MITKEQYLAVKKFHVRVVRHINEVRYKFGKEGKNLEELPLEQQIVVLMEEVGKLARAKNKLRIAVDPHVREAWSADAAHRCLTIAATAARIQTTIDAEPQHGGSTGWENEETA